MSSAKPVPATAESKPRLLVVDAAAEVCKMVPELLGKGTCEILFEGSAGQFERLLNERFPFDAVLVELSDPAEKFFEMIPLTFERKGPSR